MTARRQMPPARRRPIPGMASSNRPSADAPPAAARLPRRPTSEPASARAPAPLDSAGAAGRRPALDYAATRLVNFRLPVDLHDRFERVGARSGGTIPEAAAPEPHGGPDRAARGRPGGRRRDRPGLIHRKRAAEHGAEP